MRAWGLVTLLLFAAGPAFAGSTITKEQRKVYERLDNAANVIEELLNAPDKSVPQRLLDKAECVAVIPKMKKVGLGFGGRYGKGAVTCRRQDVPEWGAPSMITLGGGSIGLQIGVASIDVVMLIFNRSGLDRLLGDQFELGADASVAVGPIGRATTAETNIRFDAKILTYSRSKGAYAGLELKGAVIKPDRDGNFALYEAEYDARDILFGEDLDVPGNAYFFTATLNRFSPGRSPNDSDGRGRDSDDDADRD